MKNKVLHRILSILFAIILLFPFAVQTAHALEGHPHKICLAKHEKHFHLQKTNCQVFHKNIEHNAIDFGISTELISYDIHAIPFANISQKEYQLHLFYKASRAPPYFII
jgi:hypothetical protein